MARSQKGSNLALISQPQESAPPATASASLLDYGRSVIRQESEAVLALAQALDRSFDQAAAMILEMSASGHVIVSGIGKAGFIAMKISATFASIGIPSFFLNPAEALHGDLGRYTKDDLALILSNSGETDEVVRIIPQIKRMHCPIVAITGQAASTLAKYSDVVLNIGKIEEAGPLGLAPTTSTVVMLALGDALAMAILTKRGISKEQFGLYHPGGSLGRSLMPIVEIMRTGEDHCVVPESMSAREVIHRITCTKGRPGAASIVDGHGKLAGFFSDGNLRRCLDSREDFLDRPISGVMTRSPKTIRDNQIAGEALRMLSEHKIDQVIVVDGQNRPVGMIDIQDLVDIKFTAPFSGI